MKKTYFILSALLAICFLFTVESLQAQASVVSYETPQIYTYGTAIASLVPTLSGGPAEYYMVSPALPQGLNFNISTGVISGTPSIPKSAANYTVTAVNTLDGDGTFVVNIRVNKATQAIVFQALPNPKYGDTSFEALASGGGSGNPVTLTSSNDLIATCSGTTISVVGAGSCTIYADQVGNGNYAAAAQKEQTLTITKSPLTISDVTSPDKVYDGTFAATLIGGTLNGIINSENVVLVPGTGQFADANAESNKTITASGYSIEGTAAGNYSLSAQPTGITASITKIPLTITAEDKTKPYDGNPYSPFTVAYTGFVHGDTSSALTGDLSTTGTAATAVNAGTGYVITPSGLTSDNYAISFVDGSLAITKIPLTIIAEDKTKSYDGNPYSPFTVAYTGFVHGDTSSTLTGDLSTTGTAATTVNAGTGYVITPSGLTSDNYAISFVDGSLAITKIPLTITAEDKTKPYDGNPYSPFTVAYTGFVHGDTSSTLTGDLSTTGTAATAVSAGTGYVITPSGLTSDNYAISFVDGSLAITKIPLTITAEDKTKPYDGNPYSPFTVAYTGFVHGDTSSTLTGDLSTTGTAATAVNAGTGYVITPSGLTSDNYAISFVDGSLVITKIPLTITAEDKTKPYDGNPYSPFTVAYTGFVHGDTSSALTGDLSTTGTAATAVNAGTGYVITPSGLTSDNYAISFVDGSLDITKRQQTITFSSLAAKTYGDAGFELTATASSNSDITYTSDNTAVATILGGTATITGAGSANITASHAGDMNNAPAHETQSLVVSRKMLTISGVISVDKTYDGTLDAKLSGGTLNGVINSDNVTIIPGTGQFADANVGSDKPVTASGYSLGGINAGNYSLLAQPTGITANITDVTYAVTFNTPANGTLIVLNGLNPVNSGDLVMNGTVLTITALPGNGFKLVSLKANNNTISNGDFVTITNVTAISALFDLETNTDIQTSVELKIYPTITTDKVQLHFAEASKVEVVNLTGEVLQSKNLDNLSELTLSLQGYPQGMYFVKVIMKNGEKIVKSVVLHS